MTDQEKLDTHYVEYLRVKDAIADTAMELNYCSAHIEHKEMAATYQRDLDALLERFPLVIKQLVDLGVQPETLILKGLDVNIDLLAGSPTPPETEETQS